VVDELVGVDLDGVLLLYGRHSSASSTHAPACDLDVLWS
jgi:hypothetical protein